MIAGIADGATPTGLPIIFLFWGSYKAVVPYGDFVRSSRPAASAHHPHHYAQREIVCEAFGIGIDILFVVTAMNAHVKETVGPFLQVFDGYTKQQQANEDHRQPAGKQQVKKGCGAEIECGMQEFVITP